MKNKSTHAMLLTLVGGYILYIAYHLLENLLSGADDMPRGAAIAAIAVFAAGGIAVLLYAWKCWKEAKAEEKKEQNEEEESDGIK